MLFREEPEDFRSKFDIVSCFMEYENEILLLLRQDWKPEPNTYGVPAGKADDGETIYKAMEREGKQETQIDLSDAEYIDKVYVRYSDKDFVYHMFRKKFEERPEIKINPKEHKEYLRIDRKEALKLNLIEELDTCINITYPETLDK